MLGYSPKNFGIKMSLFRVGIGLPSGQIFQAVHACVCRVGWRCFCVCLRLDFSWELKLLLCGEVGSWRRMKEESSLYRGSFSCMLSNFRLGVFLFLTCIATLPMQWTPNYMQMPCLGAGRKQWAKGSKLRNGSSLRV